MDGAWEFIKNSAATALNCVINKINGLIELINKIPGVNVPIIPKIDTSSLNTVKITKKDTSKSMRDARAGLYSGHSHAGGLSHVPYNGYQATLHKGEAVLTPEENKARKNGSSGGITISKLADQIVIREEADIDKFAKVLAKQMSLATGGAV
jgi:hypothetical protein